MSKKFKVIGNNGIGHIFKIGELVTQIGLIDDNYVTVLGKSKFNNHLIPQTVSRADLEPINLEEINMDKIMKDLESLIEKRKELREEKEALCNFKKDFENVTCSIRVQRENDNYFEEDERHISIDKRTAKSYLCSEIIKVSNQISEIDKEIIKMIEESGK